MDALYQFIRNGARRSFQYGQWDCLLRLAAWTEFVTGKDAAAPWRGRCSSEWGAARILRREGGMIALLEKAYAPLGYVRTDHPQRGDIAVVDTPSGPTGAIVLAVEGNDVIASVLFSQSVRVIRAPLLAAWTFS